MAMAERVNCRLKYQAWSTGVIRKDLISLDYTCCMSLALGIESKCAGGKY